MKIRESAEDYLNSMLKLQEEHGYIRSIDLAAELGVTKPSVSYAVKRLRENGYITMDRDKFLHLTEKGMDIASAVYTKQKRLAEIFIALGVHPDTAQKDAHRIEHALSAETFDAICRYANEHMEQIEKACRGFCRHPRPECV